MKKISILLVLILFCLQASNVYSVPDFWKHSAYAIECKQTSVREVLEDFSRNFGVNLVINGQIEGTCNNWTRSDSGTDFLDKIGNEHKLQWFVYRGNLYVSPNTDNKTKRLEASTEFKEALIGLGLFQKKFGWGELVEDDVILVTGPSRYVELVSKLTRQESAAKRRFVNGDVHIFPLQFASVADRTITIRNKDVVIPGVATILKNLLEDKETIQRKGDDSDDSEYAPRKRKGSVFVESDIRTNSVLIRAPEKDYNFYKKIISDLDIESNLIEIDAIIVDINRDRIKEIGANFSFAEKNNRFNINTATTGFGADVLSEALNANATILIKDLGEFYASLKALEGDGDASIIANTSILTMDNQPAVIDLSETVFIRSVGERVVEVLPVTAGTLLNVIPRTINTAEGGKIKLVVEIEDGKLAMSSGDSDATPVVQKTTISTKAIIDQNRSLVIGGYHVQTNRSENSGIPVLKDIPAVGGLFSSKLEQTSHLERLFILTPRISPSHHNPEDYSSTGNGDLIAKAVARVKDRWANANRSYVEKTERLLSALASKKIPEGYEFGHIEREGLGFECEQVDVEYTFEGGQKVVGRGLTAFIGVVTNTSRYPLTVEESSCRGQGLVGVSLFPKTVLGAGERAEIFVSMESARMDTSSRSRLITEK